MFSFLVLSLPISFSFRDMPGSLKNMQRDGKPIMRTFEIYDGRRAFFQWDTNQRLLIDKRTPAFSQVHFHNGETNLALVVEVRDEDGKRYCEVPNILLQSDRSIKCYAYSVNGSSRTTHESIFDVIPRSRPSDYVYTETEVLTYTSLESKINDALSNINNITTMTNEDIEKILNS